MLNLDTFKLTHDSIEDYGSSHPYLQAAHNAQMAVIMPCFTKIRHCQLKKKIDKELLPFQTIVCCVAHNSTDSHYHFGKTCLECAKLHILTTRNVDILVLNVLLAKKNAPRMG